MLALVNSHNDVLHPQIDVNKADLKEESALHWDIGY